MPVRLIFSWVLRLAAAVILFQTLYFKFSGHPESVELFTRLGVEPWGRIGTGILELVTGILLLLPSTVFIGALMGLGIMAGAIISHLTILGIESKGDGGVLFYLAITVFLCCLILLVLHRDKGLELYRKLFNPSRT